MKNNLVTGTIKRHPDGFGFLIPDDSKNPDLYIPKNEMISVMNQDRVQAKSIPERGGDRFRGEIIKILERGQKVIVGAIHSIDKNKVVLLDENGSWGQSLEVLLKDEKVKKGDLIAVQITQYPSEKQTFKGTIKEIIGDSENPLNDIKRVLNSQNIPTEFSATTKKEISKYSSDVDKADFKDRKDLTKLNFITIDGATAKDFDDAIFVEKNKTGFRCLIAIADVSHYVKAKTSLDKDAYERGTSVYFPQFVVPMLPEILSNELCSLKPKVPRLALVADIQLDFNGEKKSHVFYEAVIESKARVTYGQAQEIIDGFENKDLSHVNSMIRLAADVSKILLKNRFEAGSLELEIPEVQMILGPDGIPTDMIRTERLFAHRLIEELMLLANVAVAEYFVSKNVAGIYRIHDQPKPDALKLLEKYMLQFGVKPKLKKTKLQKQLSEALSQFHDKAEAQVLNILTLRSMAQAKYSANNIGHFGLGFENYTHFTSPIRRYPDLIVHRILKSIVIKNKNYPKIDEHYLETASTMTSACEQRAVKAERQFVGIKKARFMKQHIGESFKGVISSVTRFGVFVLLKHFEVDGLVKSEKLSKEPLMFDESNLKLFSKRSGLQFKIGDEIEVVVEDANTDLGQIDFNVKSNFRKTSLDKKSIKRDKPEQKFQKKEFKFQKSKKSKFKPEQKKLSFEKPTVNKSPQVNSGKFDPARHFEAAMEKWKQRNKRK